VNLTIFKSTTMTTTTVTRRTANKHSVLCSHQSLCLHNQITWFTTSSKGTQQNLCYVCFLVAILFYVGARRATERAPKAIVVHASPVSAIYLTSGINFISSKQKFCRVPLLPEQPSQDIEPSGIFSGSEFRATEYYP